LVSGTPSERKPAGQLNLAPAAEDGQDLACVIVILSFEGLATFHYHSLDLPYDRPGPTMFFGPRNAWIHWSARSFILS
jgi:hypothetical protein